MHFHPHHQQLVFFFREKKRNSDIHGIDHRPNVTQEKIKFLL
jgi:hypothetical protein